MRLGLKLTTVAVEIEQEVEIEKKRKIDEEGELDAAEGVTNNEKALLANLHAIRAFP